VGEGGFNVNLRSASITGWWCNNHLEKYEFVKGKDDISYIMENKKNVLETTSQIKHGFG